MNGTRLNASGTNKSNGSATNFFYMLQHTFAHSDACDRATSIARSYLFCSSARPRLLNFATRARVSIGTLRRTPLPEALLLIANRDGGSFLAS